MTDPTPCPASGQTTLDYPGPHVTCPYCRVMTAVEQVDDRGARRWRLIDHSMEEQ